MRTFESDELVMQHALELARRRCGHVEPNPMVGAVVMTPERQWVADGWHEQFGGPHAEVHAITAAGDRTRGAELFVTLEPCSHSGKTPPCADAVIAAGFRRVVIGCRDPAPHVDGRGIQRLRDADVEVIVGVCESDAQRLIAPFSRLMLQQRPWVHAKWAMTLDGRVASRTGHSKWISCEASRARVHELRGRMDAIITGAGTVRADDPLLTARPPGPRRPLRVVIDSGGESLTESSRLVMSLDEAGVLVCVSQACTDQQIVRLQKFGCQTLRTSGGDCVAIQDVLAELGRRRCTNVLVEAGPALLGTFFDQQLIDEVQVFLTPKLLGGAEALSPIGGTGLSLVPGSPSLSRMSWEQVGSDMLLRGDVTASGGSQPAVCDS